MSNNLTWSGHLSTGKKTVLPAVHRSLGMLSRLSKNMSKKTLLQLVNSLAMSRLAYGMCIWGHTTDNHVKKAQVVQNMAARLVTRLPRHTRQAVLIQQCGWLNIRDWTEFQSLCQLWKTVRWRTPASLEDKLTRMENDVLTTQAPRLLLTEITFRCKSIQYWNDLPGYLRTERSKLKFKVGLKKYLKERANERDQNRTNRTADEERPPMDD